MSKSKVMMLSLGLVILFTPMKISSAQIVDDYMEVEIHNRTKEIIEEVKLEEEEVISTHAGFIQIEVEEEVEIESEWIDVNIHVSYYTDLPIENTPNKPTTDAIVNKLIHGTIAIPRDLPLHTTFVIDGFDGEYVGRDRGSKKYIKWLSDDTMKIDMYIPRNKGESDSAYYKRVNNMGITKTTGEYKLPKE